MAMKGMAAAGSWKGRGVLVTGATGMVGSWLVKDLLCAGARVVALVMDDDPQSEFYRSGDFRKCSVVSGKLEDLWAVERAVNLHETDTVIHLGAQTIVGVAHRMPLPTMESNIRGTWNVLEVCRLHPGLVKRVVVASSDKAYGEQRLPYREEMPLQGRHPYEVSKSCADLIAMAYHHTYGLPVAVARCGNIYGGGDLNWSRIVPGTIRSLLEGKRPYIRSDGKFVRDYIYVKDVARAYIGLAGRLSDRRVRGQAFNFSDGKPMSVLALVKAIQKATGCGHLKPDIRNEARGEIRDQYLSSAKARRLLGWKPQYSLSDGLAETVEWYRSFLGDRRA